jgi:hypothetical protein
VELGQKACGGLAAFYTGFRNKNVGYRTLVQNALKSYRYSTKRISFLYKGIPCVVCKEENPFFLPNKIYAFFNLFTRSTGTTDLRLPCVEHIKKCAKYFSFFSRYSAGGTMRADEPSLRLEERLQRTEYLPDSRW